jgi:hypothetical protein
MHRKREIVLPTVIIFITFLLLLIFTRSPFLNDTYYYAEDIYETLNVQSPWSSPLLWDPGHLLWRPLARLIVHPLLPLLEHFVGGDSRMAITLLLTTLSAVALFLAAILLYLILARSTKRVWLPLFPTFGFMCANTYLYALHSGTPYPPGLTCLLAGIWLAQNDSSTLSLKRAVLAGLFGGAAVCFWFPYILALPALLCWAVLGESTLRWRTAVTLTMSAATVFVLCICLGAHFRGVDSFSSFRIWFSGAGHGTEQNRNFIRSLFGLPRAFLDMGQIGIKIKQFLFHDPYAKVRFGELFRLSLWKIGLFYIALVSLVFMGHTPESAKALKVFCVALAMNIVLALAFEGGSPERYLPLFPFFFLAAAHSLSLTSSRLPTRILMSSLLVLIILGNLPAFYASRILKKQDEAASRIASLLPLPPHSSIYTIGEDSVFELRVDAPFHEINRAGDYEVTGVYVPMMRTGHWKEDFATGSLSVWEKGGEVWVTTRVLHAQPQREWNWVEGDDPKVSWKAIFDYFQPLDRGKVVGGEDGFFLLPSSATNQANFASKLGESMQ